MKINKRYLLKKGFHTYFDSLCYVQVYVKNMVVILYSRKYGYTFESGYHHPKLESQKELEQLYFILTKKKL